MREIKFRGKCVPDSKYAGQWVTSGYVAPDADCKKRDEGLIVKYLGGNTTITYHVDPATVGQYTCLKDKNGKEIYEGDVLKSHFSLEPFGIVTWHDNGYFFVDTSFGEWRSLDYACIPLGDLMGKQIDDERVQIEVIGNIHDNPELLKEDESK